jgi:hypothetical protein
MQYTFDENTHLDREAELVFDFARDGLPSPVRVQASRRFVEDYWHVDWNDDDAVRARFDAEKHKHVGVLSRGEGSDALRVYILG